MQNKVVEYQDLGLIDYKEAWDYQTNLFNSILDIKSKNREQSTSSETLNYLLTCEHPHVYTLGKSGKKDNLLLSESELTTKNASYYEINRGGDITYHGPGQLVLYPIMDLDNFFTDIHKYMRLLEESVIKTCKYFGIEAGRVDGLTGVWLGTNPFEHRKICAMGVKTSRWVTMHGLALNVNANLDYFNNIVPCGITDKQVTSMNKEVSENLNMDEVKKILVSNFAELFDCKLIIK